MGKAELPIHGAPLAQGLKYRTDAHPTSDEADTRGVTGRERITSSRNDVAAVEIVSLKTTSAPLNPQGARQRTDLHRDNWLGREKPHVGGSDD